MTEEEWLTSQNIDNMMTFVCEQKRPSASFAGEEGVLRFLEEITRPATLFHRKRRLFACACCRPVWNWMEPVGRIAVEVAERFADGTASEEELLTAYREAAPQGRGLTRTCRATMAATFAAQQFTDAQFSWSFSDFDGGFTVSAKHVLYATGAPANPLQVLDELTQIRPHEKSSARLEEESAQGALLRDIFGNPFRAVSIDLAWLTRTVTDLAQTIYQQRAFDRLPVVGDALEDAGCTSQEILDHCRQPGNHVRGCWTLDLILGRQ